MKTTHLKIFLTAGLFCGSLFVYAEHAKQTSVAPSEAISRLKGGNKRYADGNLQHPNQGVTAMRSSAETSPITTP